MVDAHDGFEFGLEEQLARASVVVEFRRRLVTPLLATHYLGIVRLALLRPHVNVEDNL